MPYLLYGVNRVDEHDNYKYGTDGIGSCIKLLKSFESKKDAEDYVNDSILTGGLKWPKFEWNPFISNVYYKEGSLLHCYEDYEIRDDNDKVVSSGGRIRHKSKIIINGKVQKLGENNV